ncbi:MAG: YfiR family protein [Chitinophagaceae bacterium]
MKNNIVKIYYPTTGCAGNFRCCRWLMVGILFLLCTQIANGQQEREANLKAAFIYNFTKYIDWDSTKAGDEFVIGVIGPSAVTAPLNEIARDNEVQNKKIVIHQFSKPEDITYTNILFIPQKLPFSLHAILEKTEKGTLTVSEEEGFAKQGTAFNFIIRKDKLKFETNLNALNAAGLKAGSQLLKLAQLVE